MPDDKPSPKPLRYHLEHSREEVSQKLQQAYVEGYVTDEELDERLELANQAETPAELQRLIADVPEESTALVKAQSTEIAGQQGRRRRDTMRAIFGGVERGGAWEVAEILEVQVIFGGVELDFRKTEMLPGETTTIRLAIIFGGLDITLPPNIRVENQVTPIFGGVDIGGPGAEGGDDGCHIVRLEGIILFGGVDMTIKKERRGRLFGR